MTLTRKIRDASSAGVKQFSDDLVIDKNLDASLRDDAFNSEDTDRVLSIASELHGG